MTARRSKDDRFLAGELTAMLKYIANLEFPSERGEGFGGPENIAFLERLRRRTEKYWPELWNEEPDQEPPRQIIHAIRHYLRLFWREPNERARDWYIHRVREYHQRRRIWRETRGLRRVMRNAATKEELHQGWLELTRTIDETLDQPPSRTPFEDALFELQERARIPSKRPLYCQNPNCKTPYFLSEKKGTKYCSPACSHAGVLASKKESWADHKEKWRQK